MAGSPRAPARERYAARELAIIAKFRREWSTPTLVRFDPVPFFERIRSPLKMIRDFTLTLDIARTGIMVWFEYDYFHSHCRREAPVPR